MPAKTGLNYYGSGNVVWIHIDILGYNDNSNTMWNIWIDDEPAATTPACTARTTGSLARSGSDVTAQCSLTDRDFHDIDIKIDTAAHTAEFYADRVSLGQLSYPNGQDAIVDRIRFERVDNAPPPARGF